MLHSYRINNELQLFSRYHIQVAENRLNYLINNRKSGNLSSVHAYSPQIKQGSLTKGTALYFISCDFKGNDPRYTDNKLEAVKAYLDVLGTDYQVVICNTLPRHNWKQILRLKNMDLDRYEEILSICKEDGKQAAEQFYQETVQAGPRVTPLSEDTLEDFTFKITFNANQHRVKQSQHIFGKSKTILWSQYHETIPSLIDAYQVALKASYPVIKEGAKQREGNLVDNIVYKQEEIVIDLHIAHSMKEQPVVGFYNWFSKYEEQTQHMKACKDFGHFQVLDICTEDEISITDALFKAGILSRPEKKPGDPEKQLAHFIREFPRLEPSLQKEFVLELLERAKMIIPAQSNFIASCLKAFKTVPEAKQLHFIAALLDLPRKKITAYSELVNGYEYSLRCNAVSEGHEKEIQSMIFDVSDSARQSYPSNDPILLFGAFEKAKKTTQALLKLRNIFGKTLIHLIAQEKEWITSVTLSEGSRNAKALEIALDAGADPNDKTSYDDSALNLSVLSRNKKHIQSIDLPT